MHCAKLIDFFNNSDFFMKEHKIRITVLKEGYSEVEMAVDPINCNYMGSLHGGLLYTLGDIAAGVSVMSFGVKCVTASGSIHYVKGVSSGKVTAVAQQVHHGRQLRVCDVKIYDEQKVLAATCTYSMFITGVPAEATE